MGIWRNVGPIYMTGVLLIVPGIFVTGPLARVAIRANGKTPFWRRWALIVPLVPVIGIWAWASAYVRVDQHAPIDLSRSHVVEALAALSIVTAFILLIWYRRQWRQAWPFLALAAWIACVACIAGLWCVEGWPAL